MQKLYGLGIFWMLAGMVDTLLPPAAAGVVDWIVSIVLFAGLGSISLSVLRGGGGFDYPIEGLGLALTGWGITKYIFHWSLINPAQACASTQPCGAGAVVFAMVLNLGMVGLGVALASVPGIPLLLAIWNSKQPK
jgi:hypothetical protein